MLRLVAARLANHRITDLFCAHTRNASFHPANHLHRRPCPARVRIRNAVPSTRPYPQTPARRQCPARARTRKQPHSAMPCPPRACTRKPPRCRAQHAPAPQRGPHAVPGTRPHPQTTAMPCPARACTSTLTARHAQHAPTPAHHPGAVPSTRPYLNAYCTPCSARARTCKPPLRCPARQYARGSFPETRTSSPPGTTPQQLKFSPHSSIAPHCLTPGFRPPGDVGAIASSSLPSHRVCSPGFGVSCTHCPHWTVYPIMFSLRVLLLFGIWFCSPMVAVSLYFL